MITHRQDRVSESQNFCDHDLLRIRQLKETLERDKQLVERRRKREREEIQHMFEEDVELLSRRREAVEREERYLNRESHQLTEYDKKRLRRLREDIERDLKTLEKREKMAAEECGGNWRSMQKITEKKEKR